MISKSELKLGEDVIVIKEKSDRFDFIGQVWKVKEMGDGELKISVSFDGEVYNFRQPDLVLA